jgi:hypothetical protein
MFYREVILRAKSTKSLSPLVSNFFVPEKNNLPQIPGWLSGLKTF